MDKALTLIVVATVLMITSVTLVVMVTGSIDVFSSEQDRLSGQDCEFQQQQARSSGDWCSVQQRCMPEGKSCEDMESRTDVIDSYL